jgi:glycosyltransferase involved in cell wall biosynthesis
LSRILFVVDSLFPLAEAYALDILVQGLTAGHQCCVCVSGGAKIADRSPLTSVDIPIHYLTADARLKHRPGALRVQASLRLRKRIQSFKPDVVHALGQPATQIAAAVLSRSPDIPLLSSILSQWRPQTTVIEMLQRCLLQRVDQFIVPHESLIPELSAFDVPQDRFAIVANAVNPGTNSNQDQEQVGFAQGPQKPRDLLVKTLGLPPSAFIAITSAPLEPVTRLKDLIWATDLLSCVRDDVHLVILGQGSQHQRLLDFAACTEAADHIHFAGLPPSAKQWVASADVYWNSHLQSPMDGGLLTAVGAAVPIVSVYGPETSPLIKHQETGFAVNFGARDEFARWTKFLIEKPAAARQLAQQGRHHAQTAFPPATMIAAIESAWATWTQPLAPNHTRTKQKAAR